LASTKGFSLSGRIGYVPALVGGAALDDGLGAEHLAHPGGQRLRAVQDQEQSVVVVQAAGDQVGQQGGDYGLVLRGPLPQPDRQLGPVGGDGQRDHHAPLGQVLAVDHEHLDVGLGQVARHQLGKRGLGLLDEPPRHRRPAGRLRRTRNLLADRLGDPGVSTRSHPGEHPLHHHLRQHVVGGEVGVGGQRHLVPIGGTGPRPGHRQPPATQGHRPAADPVPDRDPIRVVPALRPGHLGDLGLEHGLHHRQTRGHAHRQQPLTRRPGDVSQREHRLLG